ncbi:MAG: extracellular solute-binding protein [Oscillospiraceae bacterium]|nr:extracellular solute-binding protein [Oscillospiraceae bacterium]
MRKKLSICICLLLCAALLAACGGAKPATASSPEPTGGKDEAPAAAQQPQTAWQARFVTPETDGLYGGLQNLAAREDSLYFTASGVLADETPEGVEPEWPEQYWVYGPVIGKTDLDGKAEILPYVPARTESQPGENRGVLFEGLYAAPDGTLWVLENHYVTGEEENTEEKNLVQILEDGTVLQNIPLQTLAQHQEETAGIDGTYSFSVAGMAADEQGNLCVAVHEWFTGNGSYVEDNQICVLDGQSGQLRQAIPMDGEIAGLTRLADGRIVTASYSGSHPIIGLVNVKEGTIEEVHILDDFLDSMNGGREGGQLIFGASDSVFCLDVDNAEMEKLFDWTACNVAHSYDDSVCVLPDGRVVTVTGQASEGKQELAILSPADGAPTEQKVLHMAVMNLYPFTSEMVSRFNRSQSEYRIEVTDYAQYNDYTTGNPEDWNAGLTRLQTELIAGNVPDILDISLLPVNRLEAKGILEDLLPYIQADPELGLDRLNTHVLEAFEENGKLFQSVSNYYVLTTAGRSDVVGEQMGWTMKDLRAALDGLRAENPSATVFDQYTTRDDALTFLLYLELSEYVDWTTGECSFDSEGFHELLSFVKSLPTSYGLNADLSDAADLDQDTRLVRGQQLMKQCSVTCFEDMQVHTIGMGDAPCTFVGYPTEYGVGSMFAQMGNAFAISTQCADKDAAWQFVRQFFLPEYQSQFKGFAFPTNLEVYEEMKQEAMTTQYQRNPDGSFTLDADGNRVEADRGSADVGGVKVKLQAATAEDVERVEAIIAATTHTLSTDDSIKEIIDTGAAGYFADQKSLEEVVKQIQSRANIYVNEQR